MVGVTRGRVGRRCLTAVLVAAAVAGAGCSPDDGLRTTSPSTPPATTTTTPPADEASPQSLPARVSLAFTGDLLPHLAVDDQARAYGRARGVRYDFRPMFRDVRAQLARADLALCHLEVPLSPDDATVSGWPVFSAPRELAGAIAAAGYDGCSTASNHTLDQAREGVGATLDVLDAVGLGHAGSARTAAEARAPVRYPTLRGVVVAQVAGAYGYNGFVPDRPWRVGRLDPAPLIRAARRARRQGADLVVATLHWGVERRHDPTEEQRALAEQLAASGAIDLVVGHHAHVVQPVQRIHRVPVLFGLGNFLSNMTGPGERDGVIAHVRAVRPPGNRRWRFAITLTPTWVDPSSFTIRPVVGSLDRPELAPLAAELRASWRRTIAVMAASGDAHPRWPLPPA